MGSLKAKVRLKDSSSVTVLLDIGAEINVITKKVIEDASLAMQHGPKLELLSHTSHSYTFHGLCKDVKVTIERLKTRYPIFVAKYGDYDLVLGQPFLNLVKFSKKYKLDSIFGIITHSQTK